MIPQTYTLMHFASCFYGFFLERQMCILHNITKTS